MFFSIKMRGKERRQTEIRFHYEIDEDTSQSI